MNTGKVTPTALITIFIATSAFNCLADPIKTIHNSVVLVRGEQGLACSSGFVTNDGELIINSHIVQSLCTDQDCSKIKVFRAGRTGEYAGIELPHEGSPSIKDIPSLDIAILKPNWVTPPRSNLSISKIRSPVQGEDILTVGFPNCKTLTVSMGEATSVSPVRISVSALGSYGNSGSPILSPNGELLGVIEEARDPFDAIKGTVLGSPFKLKGINIDAISSVYPLSGSSLLLKEAELLNSHFLSEYKTKKGIDGIFFAFDFATMSSGVKNRITRENEIKLSEIDPKVLKALSWFGGYFNAYTFSATPQSNPELFLEVEKLMIFTNLALNGAMRSFNSPLSIEKLKGDLNNRPANYIEEILEPIFFMKEGGVKGAYFEALILALKFGIVAVCCVALWGFSGGIVYGRTEGGVGYKLLITLAVLIIFWPLSLILYCFFTSKKDIAS